MTTDVLIVGAGPTGLMLANQLGRRGVRATIIDRHSGPAQESRAMAVQARTLEIYDRLGVAAQAVAMGEPGNGANIWVHGRKRARVPLQEIGEGVSPFPYVLMLGQDDNERILGGHLRRWNMDVQWNTELVSLEQYPDHVRVTLTGPDGQARVVHASYVAGCDGGRSAVRQMNGIDFVGEPYDHVFFVADTEATGPMVPHELNSYLYKDGFNLFFPMRGRNRWRVIGILPETLRERKGITFEDLLPWLRDHLDEDLSVPALARRANLSERHFSRVFKAELGVTAAEHVETVRLESACRLLETTGRSIEQIARTCGFGTPETMNRTFRRRLNTTPGEHREHFRTPDAPSPDPRW